MQAHAHAQVQNFTESASYIKMQECDKADGLSSSGERPLPAGAYAAHVGQLSSMSHVPPGSQASTRQGDAGGSAQLSSMSHVPPGSQASTRQGGAGGSTNTMPQHLDRHVSPALPPAVPMATTRAVQRGTVRKASSPVLIGMLNMWPHVQHALHGSVWPHVQHASHITMWPHVQHALHGSVRPHVQHASHITMWPHVQHALHDTVWPHVQHALHNVVLGFVWARACRLPDAFLLERKSPLACLLGIELIRSWH
eukprot:scaffold71717_cov22-Tisochrysis_lutea.AAC.1